MIKVFSILLAFQVVLSSLSFDIGLHFCGDKLESFSLFEKAVPCEHGRMAKQHAPGCPMGKMKMAKKKGCCHDKQVVIQGQDHSAPLSDFQTDLTPHFQLAIAYVVSFVSSFSNLSTGTPEYYNYKPPLLKTDIPVLIQSFLI